MSTFELTSNGELKIAASKKSSKNDFDFLTGFHKVHHKKLKTRLNHCTEWIVSDGTQEMRQVLNNIGNVDSYHMTALDGKSIEGMALRLFNPDTRLWTIYWADSHHGTLDIPVSGSFENNIGHFFAMDKFNGKDILLQFLWDATNPDKPVWSQAFSPDNGQTWEWNWYMYFSNDESGNGVEQSSINSLSLAADQQIKVLELRNYVTKPGLRDKFIDYFETNFIDSQNVLGGCILGQFRVKAADDNFFWFRGYKDMEARSRYLPEFYYGQHWKRYRNKANEMLVNNDNVYLLKPLSFSESLQGTAINSDVLGKKKGLVVIDYYVANTRLTELIGFFKDKYLDFLKANAINDLSLWISEMEENDFTGLPVFQDKNLLVAITLYKDEAQYQQTLNKINAEANKELQNQLREIVTTRNTVILYPTKNSFSNYQKN